MTEIPDLTDKQAAVLDLLPAHIDTITDELNETRKTVRDHIEEIREEGIKLEYDRTAGQWVLNDDRAPKIRRLSTKHKSQITREANEVIQAEESYLLNRLERTEPLSLDKTPNNSDESFVVVLGDLHFGDVVEDERGTVRYNMDIAENTVDFFATKVIELYELERGTQTYADCHLILTGDIATGTHIYDGQVHDIQAYLADQVTRSAQKLIDLIITLNDTFESVSVYGVLGNHGLDRASAARGSNTDLLTYRWVQDGLRRMNIQNVEVEVAESSHALTTDIRGQTIHVRHGQQTQEHVDKTARSESDWRGIWMNARNPKTNTVGFDIAIRGHYHNPSLDWLVNTYPVFTAPSPKPGGEFAAMIGNPDIGGTRYLGWCFGVSDTRPVTFTRLVDDGKYEQRGPVR